MVRSAEWPGKNGCGAGPKGAGLAAGLDGGFDGEAPLSRAGVIGGLFVELRRALRLSMPEAARQLDTRVDVIDALEQGDVRRLPPWPETVLIVSTYTRLGGIDPLPMLEVIRSEMRAAEATLDLKPAPAAAVSADAVVSRLREASRIATQAVEAGMASVEATGRRLSLVDVQTWLAGLWRGPRTPRQVMALAIAAALPFLILLLLADGRTARGVAALLPYPLSDAALGVNEMLVRLVAPRREGLTWIEVSDPQVRKTDKLRIEGR
jgi:hypothetical protein